MSSSLERLSPLKQAYLALEEMQAKLEAAERAKREPIAVIGIGCRFPGGANDPESFWRNLRDGVDAIRDVPPDRWDVNAVYDPDPDAPGKTYTRQAGFLDRVDLFDPQFFGIAPREAVSMDPQQRLLLEVAWEALENAGIAPDKLAGSRTGVFVGIASSDYASLQLKSDDPARLDLYYGSGIAHSIASGRLSYILGLQGPSISLDTACSSSLVAAHLAVQSLRAGECHMAIVGGVNLILSPDNTIAFAKSGMLSADGRCKTFDARADGFGDGEGCGVVLLKRWSEAVAGGDRILAVIRGTAINQDGASSGLTAPNGPSQEAVIREALANGGVQSHEIGYIEAHGTGTSLGDPIEVQALGAVLREGRSADRPFVLGSVKTNFGHLEAAAGVTGLIKVVLMLQHGEIPPHLNFQTPSPFISWNEIPVVIPTTLMAWPNGYARRIVGVSSFGFSGTNAHIVLEEAPVVDPHTREEVERPLHILTLSAKSEQALTELAARHVNQLTNYPAIPLSNICFTANMGRAHFRNRLALITDSTDQAREKLAAYFNDEAPAGLLSGEVVGADRPKIAFLFTGQGSQYVNMGRRLYETQPVFRQTLNRCDEILRSHLGESILSIVYPDSDSEQPPADSQRPSTVGGQRLAIDKTAFTQPALFAIEYALAELWRSWGIVPNAVMGHSVGEYVAACVAGVFSLEDGLKLIAARGRLMGSLPGGGVMAAVFTDEARVAEAIAGHANEVSIAAINGPDNVVIAGAGAAVQTVLDGLQAQGVKSKKLVVSHAFHSPLMEPILDEFERVASEVKFAAPKIRLISNVTGKPASGQEIRTAAYWRNHVRAPVRFAASMETLHQLGFAVFVEVGPSPTLLGMGKRCLLDDTGLWLPSLRQGQDDWQQMLTSLAALYVHGVDVDWLGFDKPFPRRRVSLPTYPFQRERYWVEETGSRYTGKSVAGKPIASQPRRAERQQPTNQPANHPLLGQRLRSALKEIQFESELRTDGLALLNDHRVFDTALLPATGYLEAFTAAATIALGDEPHVLEDVVIHEGLIVPDAAARITQVIAKPEDSGAVSLQFFSSGDTEEDWKLHAASRARSQAASTAASVSLAEIQARCTDRISADVHYQNLREHGLVFGPSLRGVQQIHRRDGEALGEIELPGAQIAEASAYHLHPALLDACVQILAAAMPGGEGTYLPISLESFRLHRPPGVRVWSHVLLRSSDGLNRETLTADVQVIDEAGQIVAEAIGLRLKRADRAALLRIARPVSNFADWLYEVEWQAKPRATAGFIPNLNAIVDRAQPHVAPLSAQYGMSVYADLLPQLEALSLDYALLAFKQLGWEPRAGQRVSAEALAQQLGVIALHHRLLGRLLAILEEVGALRRVGDEWEVVRALNAVDVDTRRDNLNRRFSGSAELTLVERCGPHLAQALRGEADPLQLLFPGGSFDVAEQLYHHSPFAKTYNSLASEAIASALAQLPQGRTARILEIGAGTGGTTSFVLSGLPADHVEYTFTDISPMFTAKAQQTFERYPFVHYQTLDIEQDPIVQGFVPHHFDIVIAANVIHATADLRATLTHVKQLLAPDGLLLMIEVNRPQRWIDLTFGLTEGWWKFTDRDVRPAYPLLSRRQWIDLLSGLGFTQAIALPQYAEHDTVLSLQSIVMARGPRAEQPTGRWLIFADTGGVGARLAARLEAQGQHCALIQHGAAYAKRQEGQWQIDPARPDDFQRVLRAAAGDRCRGVVHLWSLDIPEPDTTVKAQLLGTGSVLHVTQAIIKSGWSDLPSLYLITRNAQPTIQLSNPAERPAGRGASTGASSHPTNISQSPVWGLGKTIVLEHPELHCTRIDLDRAESRNEIDMLAIELLERDAEDQIALRSETRYVARLTRATNKPTIQPIQLVITSRGTLDHLALAPMTRRAPGPGEVEIQVYATGLNFKDVMNALGMYPGDPGPLGGECAGRIAAVGAGVTDLRVGDEVIAVAGGSFSSYLTTPADLVVRKPARLSFEEAATIAIPFVTATFTLHHLGHMQAGDRVLIHAAAGGVGLAAVQLAQRAGADIFATAGSAEKRAFLQSMGVQHIMDSRSLGFADEIMSLTGGRGVDIVLNSLAGEFIPKSLSALADDGRFLEIGKSGLLDEKQAAALGRGLAYHIVDWSVTAKQDPALIRSILLEIVSLIETGELKPLPYRAFPIQDAVTAFRFMAQARRIGKIVVTHPANPAERPAGRGASTGASSWQTNQLAIRADASYLITGGLGGLGLVFARWLVERGARHIVLMGRSDPADAARKTITELEQAGAQMIVAKGDVSRREDVARVLDQIIASMPPLRGIIHSAGALDDGALVQQAWSRFETVMAPKVDGAWHLHHLTRDVALDFFVLFSSIASLLGSAGQGNHAAANTFEDALAHYRRAQGLPALSVNWGAWSEVGAAVEHGVDQRVATQGIGAIAPEHGIRVMEYLLESGATQVGVMPIDWSRFITGIVPPFLSKVAILSLYPSSLTQSVHPSTASGQRSAQTESEWSKRITDAPAAKQRSVLIDYVRAQAGRVLGIDAAKVRERVPLNELGLDSLMAVELRNRLGTGLALPRKLPATLVFDYPTIEAMADYLGREVLPQQDTREASKKQEAGSKTPEPTTAVVDTIEGLSDEEVDRLLAQKMSHG